MILKRLTATRPSASNGKSAAAIPSTLRPIFLPLNNLSEFSSLRLRHFQAVRPTPNFCKAGPADRHPEGKPFRGAVVQSLNVLQIRLCSTGLLRSHRAAVPDNQNSFCPCHHVHPSFTNGSLRHVRQKILQITVRGADKNEVRESLLSIGRVAFICRATPTSGSSAGLVSIRRWIQRRPLNVRIVIRTARGNVDQGNS